MSNNRTPPPPKEENTYGRFIYVPNRSPPPPPGTTVLQAYMWGGGEPFRLGALWCPSFPQVIQRFEAGERCPGFPGIFQMPGPSLGIFFSKSVCKTQNPFKTQNSKPQTLNPKPFTFMCVLCVHVCAAEVCWGEISELNSFDVFIGSLADCRKVVRSLDFFFLAFFLFPLLLMAC